MSPVATDPEGHSGSWFGLQPFISRTCLAVYTVLGLGLAVEQVPCFAPYRILHPVARAEAPSRTGLYPPPAVGEARISTETETRSELSQPDSAALKDLKR